MRMKIVFGVFGSSFVAAACGDAHSVDTRGERASASSESAFEAANFPCDRLGTGWTAHPEQPRGVESCQQGTTSRVAGARRQSRTVCRVTCDCTWSWTGTHNTCPSGSTPVDMGEGSPIPFCSESETWTSTEERDVESAVCETTSRFIQAQCDAICGEYDGERLFHVGCCVRGAESGDPPSHVD